MTNKKRRQPPRVLRHLMPCPDCGASFDGMELQHEDSCPLANGVDDICDEDRRYFLDHPGEWTRTRAITRAEYQTLVHLDPAGAATDPTHVHVINQPWGRIRQFCNHNDFSGMALDTDDAAS
jgi:hypothetical protein